MLLSTRAQRLAQALDGGAVTDARTAQLLGVVRRLDALPRPAAPGSTAAGVSLLAAAAAVQVVGKTAAGHLATTAAAQTPLPAAGLLARLGAMLPSWAPVATGALATAVVGTGLTFATTQALPGDTLYGVKSGVQDARSATAAAGLPTAVAHLGRADERMSDLVALQARGQLADRAEAVRAALVAWTADSTAGVDALLGRARAGSAQARSTLQQFVVTSRTGLGLISPSLPPAAVAEAAGAVALVTSTAGALTALPDGPVQPAPVTPTPVTPAPVTATTSPSTVPVLPLTAPTAVPPAPSAGVPSVAAPTVPGRRTPATPGLPTPRVQVPTTLPTLVPTSGSVAGLVDGLLTQPARD